MKEAVINKDLKVEIIDTPIPKPKAGEVIIKVVVSGSNPKDWKLPMWLGGPPSNQGDDVAGIVHEVGEGVFEFKPGDRVAAFHEMTQPGGSYAEYAVAPAHTTFHIPETTTFEEAAAIPLAAITAALALYRHLSLPQPWTPATSPTPLIIYGASSAVGSYAVQLAVRSNIHPLLCVAGNSQSHVSKLIDASKGDVVLDYRSGPDALASALRSAAGDQPLLYALDAISEKGSYAILGKVLGEGAKLTMVLPPGPDYDTVVPKSVQHSRTSVGAVHVATAKDDVVGHDFGYVYTRYFARGLKEGWFRPQPQVVVPGGLGGVQKALEDLRDGKASAVKYVFRIEETEGVE